MTLSIADHSLKDSPVKTEKSGYTSNILRLLFEYLDRHPESHLLDLGLISGDNINFFIRRVKKLYVCDMFFHLDRQSQKALTSRRLRQYFDYPPLSFDGILLWNLIDYLDEQTAQELVQRCFTAIKPGGRVMVIAQGEKVVFPVFSSFAIREGFSLYPQPQPKLNLPLHSRQNREVLRVLAPFSFAKSYLYRNGVREYLFLREEDPSPDRDARASTKRHFGPYKK